MLQDDFLEIVTARFTNKRFYFVFQPFGGTFIFQFFITVSDTSVDVARVYLLFLDISFFNGVLSVGMVVIVMPNTA
jgi:hypothetical protein